MLFRPVYREEGNITELLFLQEGRLVNAYDRRSLPSVRQALARSYALDLSAQARDLKKKLQRRSLMPICLPDGRVFVPLKMRRPRITRDSTYGYIDIAFIKTVQEKEETANLLLVTGEVIPLCTSAAAALNAINQGKLMAKRAAPAAENEQQIILSALSLLVDKLYRIESLLKS